MNVFASIVYPRLTTIRVNVEEKAETAVEVLMKLINRRRMRKERIQDEQYSLSKRESVEN